MNIKASKNILEYLKEDIRQCIKKEFPKTYMIQWNSAYESTNPVNGLPQLIIQFRSKDSRGAKQILWFNFLSSSHPMREIERKKFEVGRKYFNLKTSSCLFIQPDTIQSP